MHRERSRGQYGGPEYLLAKLIAELPLDASFAAAFGLLLKRRCGLRAAAPALVSLRPLSAAHWHPTHQLTHQLTHQRTHSCILYSLTIPPRTMYNSLTHSLTHSPTHALMHTVFTHYPAAYRSACSRSAPRAAPPWASRWARLCPAR